MLFVVLCLDCCRLLGVIWAELLGGGVGCV